MPPDTSARTYHNRLEKRRQRRSLKDSGDFLGVQGINPSTGEMDVLTPSTSSAGSPFMALAKAVQEKRTAYEHARSILRSETLRRWEIDKSTLRAARRKSVRWRKAGEGWSSAVEPNLSPIAGSTETPPRGNEFSVDTVIQMPIRPPTRTPSLGRAAGRDGVGRIRSRDREQIGGAHAIALTSVPSNAETGSRIASHNLTTQREFTAAHENDVKLTKPRIRPQGHTPSIQESYSDLIPVNSEFDPQSPSSYHHDAI
ncbi:hypothetical protein BD289DRAFT_479006 [Coniella lustricola]|uniref:Uncharacterized protein n=1 Tax=Coniella lustricola TaxID=2025994 RepID=A0A2T3AKC2_9PEZI|nr:hypothetical protein BD289DRAFT_479006 [Coniella lustricola]